MGFTDFQMSFKRGFSSVFKAFQLVSEGFPVDLGNFTGFQERLKGASGCFIGVSEESYEALQLYRRSSGCSFD